MRIRALKARSIAVAIGATLVGSPLARAQGAPAGSPVEEELIAEVDSKMRLGLLDFAISADGKIVAWKGKHETGQAAFVNGSPGPIFEDVNGVVLGSHQVAYRAKKAGKWIVVRDSEQVGGSYDHVDWPIFTPDGRVGFIAKDGPRGERTFILDGKAESFPAREATLPVFSLGAYLGPALADTLERSGLAATAKPDARLPASRMARAVKLADSWHMIVDGVLGPAHPEIGRVSLPWRTFPIALFSPDGSRLAYVISGKAGNSVVVDDKEPDGSRLAYVISGKAGHSVVVDGKEEEPFSRLTGFRFSADGKRYAYVGIDSRGSGRVVVDGRPGPAFKPPGEGGWAGGVTAPVFSDDGAHFAYAAQVAKDSAQVFVDHEGLPGTKGQGIMAGPVFGPEGKLVYVAWEEVGEKPRIVEVVAGSKTRSFPTERGINFVEHLTLHRGSPGVAYVIGRGGAGYAIGSSARARRRVIANGVEGATYDAEDLDDIVWSGETLAYRVRRVKDGKDFVVLNGQPGPHYDEIFAGRLRIDAEGRAVYVARADRRLLRVLQGARSGER